ncbi:polysaccharide deacetylase family protein, partial [Fibrobacterota bacterium]
LMGLTNLFADNHPYSQLPPGDLDYSECPMFVCFGFDDNAYVEGMKWFADLVRDKVNPADSNNPATYDGSPVRATFFITAGFGHEDYFVNAGGQTKEQVIQAWKGFYDDGHEIANHSWNHPHGSALSKEEWKQQVSTANDFLVANIGISANEIQGFRTPYLEYSANTMDAIKELGFTYDCSIEFGYNGWVPIEPDSGYWNGMTDPKTHMKLFWPHTLDNGSPPGHSAVGNPTVAGLWEVPVYTCLKQDNSGVVTGFDFNLWKIMDKNEFLETLKHNFDLRRQGNRNPLSINTHTDYYTQYNTDANTEFTKATWAQRQDAIEEFLDYVLQFPETRIVSFSDMLKWMKDPVAIGPTAITGKTPDIDIAEINAKIVSGNRIMFTIPFDGLYSITLINLEGRTVMQQSQWHDSEEGYIFFDSPIPGGIYMVRFNCGNQIIMKKAILAK